MKIMTIAMACVALMSSTAARGMNEEDVLGIDKISGISNTPLSAYTPEIRKSMEQLYRNKVGLFVHFGPAAYLEGYWQGKKVSDFWIMNRARIPVKVYENEAAKKFNPEKFNAHDFVKAAQDGGLRFIVATSKHHDGFVMFRSAHPYNIYDFRPMHRDLMKELADACHEAGLGLGFYYSHCQDWHEDGGAGNSWDFPPLTAKRFGHYFQNKVLPQVTELATGYGKLFMFWFDTPMRINAEQCQQLMKLVAEKQPGALVNSRLGCGFGHYVSSLDFGLPPAVVKRNWLPDLKIPWQTHDSLAGSWGYTKDGSERDRKGKYSTWINEICFVVSRGGVLLLNVAPAPDGSIPQTQLATLKEIGNWLRTNGEAIYGADPSSFLFPPYPITAKPGKLYLHLKDFKGGQTKLDGLLTEVSGAHVLSDKNQMPLKFSQKNGRLSVEVPSALVFPHMTVVALDLRDKAAKVADETITAGTDGRIALPYSKCEYGKTMRIGYDPDKQYSVRWGESQHQLLVWTVRFDKPGGEYRIFTEQNAEPDLVYQLSVVEQKVEINARGASTKVVSADTGKRLSIAEPGTYKIIVRPVRGTKKLQRDYHLKSLALVPVK
jgi:alpha-L-fucosidase